MEAVGLGIFPELDQEIQVTAFRLESTRCRRAEDVEALHAQRPAQRLDLSALCCQLGYHRLLLTTTISELPAGIRRVRTRGTRGLLVQRPAIEDAALEELGPVRYDRQRVGMLRQQAP